MKSPRKFPIPVGWNHNGLREPEEHIPSTTQVLHVPKTLNSDFEIERVRGSWSPHIPEKRPHYCISQGRHYKFMVEPIRLAKVPQLDACLVLRAVRRVQRCFVRHGIFHALHRGGSHPMTFCGENPYVSREEAEVFQIGTPNCTACFNAVDIDGYGWVFYYVYPYEDKREVEKSGQKAKTLAKRRERLPTIFDRLLLDDPLNPPPKKPKELQEAPEHDPEEDLIPSREAKLAARRDASERFRRAKHRTR